MSPASPAAPARVLVLGDERQAVTVVRSLARAGLEVTLGTDDPASSTARSRFVADVWVYDNGTPQRFCNHVEAFLRSERPDYFFPIGAQRLRALAEAAPRLARLACWAGASSGALARCLDASAMQALAASLGIPTSSGAPRLSRACHVAALDGRLIAYFEEGGPLACSAAPSAELRRHCEALLGALGYTGTACVFFDGAFVELVAGVAATLELPYRMGIDFPRIAIELAASRQAPARSCSYPAGRTLRWPGFDWRDPLPTLHLWWRRQMRA